MNIELKNKPLVSIIIPAYNVGRYIENCILSIIRQSYGNIEILVVNDGSSDETPNIIDKAFIRYLTPLINKIMIKAVIKDNSKNTPLPL